ncbi:MAG TPA: cation diffusion facilitator family transporter, partial [bacterium]|nr:cation diffusion facilitator family transporter [bacterium]
ETILLFVTCVWIIYEAVSRLLFEPVSVQVTVWSFLVVLLSIVVDVSRSRALSRAAKKYRSQALEADALHFSTDIWSSAVVLLGLIFVKLHVFLPKYEFLHEADAVAALLVAAIVVYVSFRMGFKTVQALIDTAPSGLEKKIVVLVEAISGVKNCHQVRMRYSGARLFIDAHVAMNGSLTLDEAHQLMDEIEAVISKEVPESDVTVHPEPL